MVDDIVRTHCPLTTLLLIITERKGVILYQSWSLGVGYCKAGKQTQKSEGKLRIVDFRVWVEVG